MFLCAFRLTQETTQGSEVAAAKDYRMRVAGRPFIETVRVKSSCVMYCMTEIHKNNNKIEDNP